MKLLGLLIGGVILGYLIGAWFGENQAVNEGGFLSFFVIDSYRAHYALRGAVGGGFIGAIAGCFAQFGDSRA
jgi:hypothetical protein